MAYRRIHCYAASLGHDLGRRLVETYGRAGGTVLDPFAGSGTVLLEALSAGHYAVGIDVDPIACLITRVQTRKYTTDDLTSFTHQTLEQLSYLQECLRANSPTQVLEGVSRTFEIGGLQAKIPELPEIDYWFSETQQVTLATLIAYLHSISDARLRDIFAVSVSSSIVRKWPNTLSLAMDIDHSRPHRAVSERATIDEQFNLFRRVFQLTAKVLIDRARVSPAWTDEGRVIEGNCAEEMLLMRADSVDLILSSPPYVNAIDYPRSHKFSEWWLSPTDRICKAANYVGLRGIGQDPELVEQAHALAPKTMRGIRWLKDKAYRGKAGKIYRYVVDIDSVVAGCEHVLAKEGQIVFILADNHINGRVVPVVNIVMELLERRQFLEVSSYERDIKKTRRRYPFGFKGTMQREAVITARM